MIVIAGLYNIIQKCGCTKTKCCVTKRIERHKKWEMLNNRVDREFDIGIVG